MTEPLDLSYALRRKWDQPAFAEPRPLTAEELNAVEEAFRHVQRMTPEVEPRDGTLGAGERSLRRCSVWVPFRPGR